MQVLKVALIFEACRAAMNETELVELRSDTLELAIRHVEECLQAACFLDSIANRVFIAGEAETLLEKIRLDFASLAKNGSIIVTPFPVDSKVLPTIGTEVFQWPSFISA